MLIPLIGTSPLEAWHYDDLGISDGYDSWDVNFLNPFSNRCSIYSDIGTHKLRRDYRQPTSPTPFDIKLVYNGNLGADTPNHLTFALPWVPPEWDYIFGTKPILFQSNLLPYGNVVDVRRAIAENGGIVPLVDLPAGNYSLGSPYGEGIITIGTRLLSDLNDSNDVNFEDFAIFKVEWKQSGSGLVSDICGVNGIPDGTVDMYDLTCFIEEWLMSPPL